MKEHVEAGIAAATEELEQIAREEVRLANRRDTLDAAREALEALLDRLGDGGEPPAGDPPKPPAAAEPEAPASQPRASGSSTTSGSDPAAIRRKQILEHVGANPGASRSEITDAVPGVKPQAVGALVRSDALRVEGDRYWLANEKVTPVTPPAKRKAKSTAGGSMIEKGTSKTPEQEPGLEGRILSALQLGRKTVFDLASSLGEPESVIRAAVRALRQEGEVKPVSIGSERYYESVGA